MARTTVAPELPTVSDAPEVVAAREKRNQKREAVRAAREDLALARKGAEGPEDRAIARRLGAPSEAAARGKLEILERELQVAEENFAETRARAEAKVVLVARDRLRPLHERARQIIADLAELAEAEVEIQRQLRARGFSDAHRCVGDAAKIQRLMSHARAL